MKRLPGCLALFALLTGLSGARTIPKRGGHNFEATAFSRFGTTSAGTEPHIGIVAADNRVLPLGTRIRVTQAGIYSGIYIVRDTGSKVQGRHIDIYIPNRAAARRFGKKIVRVRVLRWGSGEPVTAAAPASQRTALSSR